MATAWMAADPYGLPHDAPGTRDVVRPHRARRRRRLHRERQADPLDVVAQPGRNDPPADKDHVPVQPSERGLLGGNGGGRAAGVPAGHHPARRRCVDVRLLDLAGHGPQHVPVLQVHLRRVRLGERDRVGPALAPPVVAVEARLTRPRSQPVFLRG